MSHCTNDTCLTLTGLDGSNPLAFLAALGTLRTLGQIWSDRSVKLSWIEYGGAWRPRLFSDDLNESDSAKDRLGQKLHSSLKNGESHVSEIPEKNLKLFPQAFRDYLEIVRDRAIPMNRSAPDLASALGTEAVVARRGANAGMIQRSSIQMVNGGKRQD